MTTKILPDSICHAMELLWIVYLCANGGGDSSGNVRLQILVIR